MGDFRRENTGLLLKWGIFKDKMHDFRLNAGFAMRKLVIFAKMGDFRRENARYSLKCVISEEKIHDFRLNGGFSKRKRVICGLKRGILE